MTDSHPITPSPELVQQWTSKAAIENMPEQIYIATQAACWGADQELEACVEWLNNTDVDDSQEAAKDLRAARRPKPLSLVEQALDALNEIEDKMLGPTIEENLIRAALERLKELEQSND